MSNSVRPQRRQPTRLPRPWDSPGKNTGVGCHVLLQCMKVKSESEVTQSCPTLSTSWTAAYQALLSMGFSRQKYWSGVPLPSLSMGIGVGVAKRSGSDLLSYCISCSEIDYLTLLLSNYFNSVLGGKSKTTQDYLIKIYDPFDLPKE